MPLRTARLDRDANVLIVSRSKGSRNATSTTLHVCLCARTDCVSLEDGVTNRLGVASGGHRYVVAGRQTPEGYWTVCRAITQAQTRRS
jgi:hypothetical protein